ncbi:MAG: extracellular solute-binding protein [Clostridia bacterium]|nr:extracellular solute-binding protein [Clostridia bacterium]
MKRIYTVLILIAMVFMFAGCADDGGSQRNPKQEIVLACGKDATGTLVKVVQEFNSQSETTQVKLMEFSNESVELHRVVSSMLSGQEVHFDAMLIEDVWVGEFCKNDYLMPLDISHEFDKDEYPKGIDSFMGDDENIYWYPVILDAGIMYYRKDLAQGSQRLDYIANGDKGTYAIQGVDGEEMLSCALEFVNLTDNTAEGLKLYKKAIDNFVCDDSNYMTEFKNGNATYMRAWSSHSRNIMQGFSAVSGLVGADVMTSTDGSSYAVTRSYGFSVNHRTPNGANCMEFLEYLNSDTAQMQILKGMGTLPIKREHYTNPVILDYSEYLEDAASIFDRHIFRPYRDDYTFVSREARKALKAYIQGEGSLEAAVETVENLSCALQ